MCAAMATFKPHNFIQDKSYALKIESLMRGADKAHQTHAEVQSNFMRDAFNAHVQHPLAPFDEVLPSDVGYNINCRLYSTVRSSDPSALPTQVLQAEGNKKVAVHPLTTDRKLVYEKLGHVLREPLMYCAEGEQRERRAEFRHGLQLLLKDQDAFESKWQKISTVDTNSDTDPVMHRSFEWDAGSGGRKMDIWFGYHLREEPEILCDVNGTGTDKVFLRRSVSEVNEALRSIGMQPMQTVVKMTSLDADGPPDQCLLMLLTPCANCPNALMRLKKQGLASVSLTGIERAVPSRKTALCVATIGIQHDRGGIGSDDVETPLHLSRKIAMVQTNLPLHPRYGVDSADLTELMLPHVIQYAENVGRIHMMSQCAKTILKQRPEKSEAVQQLTCEQRGTHLKNAHKLILYWKQLDQELTSPERRCLNNAMRILDDRSVPLTMTCTSAQTAQAACDLHNRRYLGTEVKSREAAKPAQRGRMATSTRSVGKAVVKPDSHQRLFGVHHLGFNVNMKSMLNFPLFELGEQPGATGTVHINNPWVFECQCNVFE